MYIAIIRKDNEIRNQRQNINRKVLEQNTLSIVCNLYKTLP